MRVSAEDDFLSYFPAIDPDPRSLTRGCIICQPSCFVRRRAIERVGGLDTAAACYCKVRLGRDRRATRARAALTAMPQTRPVITAVAPSASEDLVDRVPTVESLAALATRVYRYRELLKNLVLKDLKLKYRGSAFGFLWSLANPLLMISVYAVAFNYILRVGRVGYVFHLMLAVLAWTFFANSATMATGANVDNAGLLKNVAFPRVILPLATVLFNLIQYLLTISIFLPVMILWYRVPLSAFMALFFVFLVLQVMFTTGVALLLATCTAFFRDTRHLLEVGLAVMFWTTPILYQVDQLPAPITLAIYLSPMSPFVIAYQRLFYFRVVPEVSVWAIAAAYAIAVFVVGVKWSLAMEQRVMDRL
jgi:lipopolysaccharide transport system permease protein